MKYKNELDASLDMFKEKCSLKSVFWLDSKTKRSVSLASKI